MRKLLLLYTMGRCYVIRYTPTCYSHMGNTICCFYIKFLHVPQNNKSNVLIIRNLDAMLKMLDQLLYSFILLTFFLTFS